MRKSTTAAVPSERLRSAPVQITGDWGQMLPHSARRIIRRSRQVCLENFETVSDRQPERLRVERHESGSPAIWLHPGEKKIAWIIVNIGERDWSKLAYQFGHELGHVLANSWNADAKPEPPCQWVEEAMVEAFSLHGLGRLATDWEQNPPFAGDNAFGGAIEEYRQNIIKGYEALVASQGLTRDPAAWFADNRSEIEIAKLNPFAQAMSLTILAEYERAPECIEAIGALNRWPGRSGVPVDEYLQRWEASCAELQASPHLPIQLHRILGLR